MKMCKTHRPLPARCAAEKERRIVLSLRAPGMPIQILGTPLNSRSKVVQLEMYRYGAALATT